MTPGKRFRPEDMRVANGLAYVLTAVSWFVCGALAGCLFQ